MKKATYIGKYNRIIQETYHLPESVGIFDTTLRDGEQTPGVSITHDEKLCIAGQLDKLGVRVIEAGFPANSKAEEHTVKEISGIGFRSDICGLSRVIKEDIDACIDCDLAASLIGGLGVSPSANIGGKFGMFEPVHGSAPDITGQGIANPIGAVLSAKMMLEYLGETKLAKIIEDAVRETLKENLTRTVDISSLLIDKLDASFLEL